jgi:hypothetical protein
VLPKATEKAILKNIPRFKAADLRTGEITSMMPRTIRGEPFMKQQELHRKRPGNFAPSARKIDALKFDYSAFDDAPRYHDIRDFSSLHIRDFFPNIMCGTLSSNHI